MFFIKYLFKKHESLLMEFFFRSRHVDPALDGDGREVIGVVFQNFLDDLTSALQLSSVPQKLSGHE